MAKQTEYKVARPHQGDRWYDKGDTRVANPADVKHLVGRVLIDPDAEGDDEDSGNETPEDRAARIVAEAQAAHAVDSLNWQQEKASLAGEIDRLKEERDAAEKDLDQARADFAKLQAEHKAAVVHAAELEQQIVTLTAPPVGEGKKAAPETGTDTQVEPVLDNKAEGDLANKGAGGKPGKGGQ